MTDTNTTAPVVPFVLKTTEKIRLNGKWFEPGTVIKYAMLPNGVVGLRFEDGSWMKMKPEAWRYALAYGTVIPREEVVTALGIVHKNPDRAWRIARSRLNYLGYVTDCGRCGGTGQYSYCQMFGTKCFQCEGRTKVTLRVTRALLHDALLRIQSGELIPYFAATEARAKAKLAISAVYQSIEADTLIGDAYEVAYKAAKPHTGELVDTPLFLAQHLSNSIRAHAHETWLRFTIVGDTDYENILTTIQTCKRWLDEVREAWIAFNP